MREGASEREREREREREDLEEMPGWIAQSSSGINSNSWAFR